MVVGENPNSLIVTDGTDLKEIPDSEFGNSPAVIVQGQVRVVGEDLVIFTPERDSWPDEWETQKQKAKDALGDLFLGDPWLPDHPVILTFKKPSEKEINEQIRSMTVGPEIVVYDPTDIVTEILHELGHIYWSNRLKIAERDAFIAYHKTRNKGNISAIYTAEWWWKDADEMFATIYMYFMKGKLLHEGYRKILSQMEPEGYKLFMDIVNRIAQDEEISREWKASEDILAGYLNSLDKEIRYCVAAGDNPKVIKARFPIQEPQGDIRFDYNIDHTFLVQEGGREFILVDQGPLKGRTVILRKGMVDIPFMKAINRGKLVRKVIVNSKGHRQTVWVKPVKSSGEEQQGRVEEKGKSKEISKEHVPVPASGGGKGGDDSGNGDGNSNSGSAKDKDDERNTKDNRVLTIEKLNSIKKSEEPDILDEAEVLRMSVGDLVDLYKKNFHNNEITDPRGKIIIIDERSFFHLMGLHKIFHDKQFKFDLINDRDDVMKRSLFPQSPLYALGHEAQGLGTRTYNEINKLSLESQEVLSRIKKFRLIYDTLKNPSLILHDAQPKRGRIQEVYIKRYKHNRVVYIGIGKDNIYPITSFDVMQKRLELMISHHQYKIIWENPNNKEIQKSKFLLTSLIKSIKNGIVTAKLIRELGKKVDTDPTEAQKRAGNYRKARFYWNGLAVTIENPRGSYRSGVDKNGTPWKSVIAFDYGYFNRTTGADKDHVDVFIGNDLESPMVYVINQVDPETGDFDEHKVMIGFGTEEEARAGYLKNYSPGWRGIGSIVSMDIDEFKSWLKHEDQNKPATEETNGVKRTA